MSVLTAVLVMGIFVGLPAGLVIARAQRQWRDYRTIRASVKPARAKAWELTRGASGRTALVVAAVVLFVVVTVWGQPR